MRERVKRREKEEKGELEREHMGEREKEKYRDHT